MKEWFKARNIWGAAILSMSDEEAGRFAKALWTLTMTGEAMDLEGSEKGLMAIASMMLQMDEQKANDLSAVRAEAGAKGGQQKAANGANATNDIANVANANFANDDVANVAKNTIRIKNKNKSKNIDIDNDISQRFDRFWAAYPNKKAKQDAFRAFQKLKPDDDLLNRMLAALEREKESAQWQESGGRFIPHPATWLNGRRWEDETTSPTPAQAAKHVVAQDYPQREYEVGSETPDQVYARLFGDAG